MVNFKKSNIVSFIVLYAVIAVSFLVISPWTFSSEWVSSSDFHACIEISSSFIAIIAAIACLIYYFGLKNRYFLIIGLGFFVCGSEDFIHGLFSFERLVESSGVDFSRFIPGTYVAGRIMLAVAIITAIFLEKNLTPPSKIKREAILFSCFAIVLGSGVTAVAFSLPLPEFIYPENFISRPVDMISAGLFMAAFLLAIKRFINIRDIFSGMLLACILLNLGGQIFMSFSKQLFDVFFDTAHLANILSYCMPVMGITIESLDKMRRAQIETNIRKEAEDALQKLNQDLQISNKELNRSNRELQDFVYIASHDLREPLRKISSFGELLKDSLRENLEEDDRENLDFMIEGASRMTQMIEALLVYSRLNTKEVLFKTIDLNEIIEQLEQLELAALIEETEAVIEVPQYLPEVRADLVQIRQLFQNIIVNGIKYQREGISPRIVITAEQIEDGKVSIKIQDNGIGIKEELHKAVFKMFKRVHSRSEYEGTGIGLAVCRKIIDRHGGQIGVDSQEGKGSVFWFTLTLADESVQYRKDSEIKEKMTI
ncbi:MAG: ATP-binding protein [Planctomycetota bacterium]|jgi:signal transduction histidine kinase